MIPYGRQHIEQRDVDAVVEVLRSDYLTQGPRCADFERAVVALVGAKHGVAVNSATSALHVACMALDLGPGDSLWTSANTFVASANCGRYCGADVDFVDVDPRTYNMCAKALANKLAVAEKLGKVPKIVVPVHFAGQSCDMRAISELAAHYGFKIIEDASHAVGGDYLDAPIGGCVYSDITVFSFHPVKIITTAEGGICITNKPELAQRMELARSHGVTRDSESMEHCSHGPWYYEQISLGYNYRLTELQAALGLNQLKSLTSFVDRRHALAARYDELLADFPLRRPFQSPDGRSALHLYPVVLDDVGQRRQVFESLRAADILVNVHYTPVYLQPYYRRLGFQPGYCPQAEAYYGGAISLPLFYDLTDEQQDLVVAVMRAAFGA